MEYLRQHSNAALICALSLLMSFMPYAMPVAEAQETLQTKTLREREATTYGAESSPSSSGRLDSVTRNGKQVFHVDLKVADRHSEAWFDRNSLSFGDGYSLVTETVANSPDEFVEKLTAIAADHRHTVATVRLDRHSQGYSFEGTERVNALLAESDHFQLFKAFLPVLTSAAQATATSANKHRPSTMASDDAGPFTLDFLLVDIDASLGACLAAILGGVAAFVLVIAACFIPEPLEPWACYGAILALMAAMAGMEVAC